MAAAFVFMGIEAVTAVREYIQKMTRSELFTLMTGFMATIAGSVMAAYVSFGASAGHLLAASVMSAPAAIVISKLMVPETGRPVTSGGTEGIELRSEAVNVVEAAANGATDGLKLALTIGAMLLAFVSIIAYLFAPFAFIMGVPWEDCLEVGKLLGIKVIFNEFISYQRLETLIEGGTLAARSVTISTYALCSFANFGSLAIVIGGIGGIAPERKKEVARLGLRALAAGCIAGFMTATVAGMLI
jgi:CNT family concentrative nucleoside transporter